MLIQSYQISKVKLNMIKNQKLIITIIVIEMEPHSNHIILIKIKILLVLMIIRNFKNNFQKSTEDNNNKNSRNNL
jgi:hypothetical protein